MSNLLILGAGVEKTQGINMPLANELVPQIRDFLMNTAEGQECDKALRKIIKGLRFNYDDFVKSAVDKLASDFKKEVNVILSNINEVLKKSDELDENEKKIGQILIKFLTQIQKLQEDVVLDEESAEIIKDLFGEISVSDLNIVDLGKLTFTDTFSIVMKNIFEMSIKEPNHPVLKYVYKNLMDLENLLLKSFVGFYNDNEYEVKKYLYISWTLWAFLVHKERQATSPYPFYSNIKKVDDVITFNYTKFAAKAFVNPIYFHGNLRKYIRIDNRNQIQIDDYDTIAPSKFISDILSQNIIFDENIYTIPSIIPPLKLKPVLSNEYIDIWYDSVSKIREANKIIVVGYSFNYADEHFNDLIRKSNKSILTVIDPNAEYVIKNLQKITNLRLSDYSKAYIQGKEAFVTQKVKVIKAFAEQVNIDDLFEND